MSTSNAAAVLRLAKELCTRDGKTWEATLSKVTNGFTPKAPGTHNVLSEKEREEYLARARKELCNGE